MKTPQAGAQQAQPAGSEPIPEIAHRVFGSRLALATRYAQRLAVVGSERGLIGPREAERVWDRHLVNSALVTELVPAGARVVDVGSGAGLPGIPMAIRRPDLRLDLVEPMQRRVAFLTETVAELDLTPQIRVVRGRADDREVLDGVGGADWVVARAVAPLDRLVRWCLPLVVPGGVLLAQKGAGAAEEAAQYRQAMRRAGAGEIEVQEIGAAVGHSTWVVVIRRARAHGAK